jgi:hypothetical protein
MKRIIFTLALSFFFTSIIAQEDSLKKAQRTDTTIIPKTDTVKPRGKVDTIRIGGMVIIKRGERSDKDTKNTTILIGQKRKKKQSNISKASWIVDLGFANFNDKIDYPAAINNTYLVNKPGDAELNKNDLKLKTGKSINVNLWFFMQRINMIKHVVNLQYGLGLELNNYRFKSDITFKESGKNPYNASQNIPHAFIFRDSISYSKNKLAADYVTIPLMINLRNSGDRSDNKRLSISGGISLGYLYRSRNKQISDEKGKEKNHGNFDIRKWKFAYIGELGLGPVKLYGSYAPKSIFENGLNLMPYNVGVRLSNW